MNENVKKIIRCAIYTRQSVSRGSEDHFNSCEAQREACELYVRSMQYEGWRLIEQRFDDLGCSGKNFNRPAFRRLLESIAKGNVDQIVVHRFDRLTRNLHDWSKLNEFLGEYSVTLSVVEGAGEATGGAFTEFVNNILATFGQFEREIINERLQEARKFRAAKGMRFAGRPPVGYTSDPITKQLVIQEKEANLVRLFFELAAKGESAATIANIVNKEGYRTKRHGDSGEKLWIGKTVLQVLRNPIYCGNRIHENKSIAGIHEAIVSPSLASEAIRQIQYHRTRKPGRRKKVYGPDPFMLRGIIRCGTCSRLMTTSSSRKIKTGNRNDVPRYYRCRGNSERPACIPTVQVAAHLVETKVIELLKHPWKIKGTSRATKKILTDFASKWDKFTPTVISGIVRDLVWSATWDPASKEVFIEIDEINLERILH